MDNIIMIQAGDFIDSTLGVTFGISTLTAAALGNVCSDSSGVLFGGVVESASERLKLAKPQLSLEQAQFNFFHVFELNNIVELITQLLALRLQRRDFLVAHLNLDQQSQFNEI